MQRRLIYEFETYAREPILRRMPDGSLICLFLTGGPREPHNENATMISRSFDDGETWTEPEVLFSHSHRGVWCSEVFAECDPPFIAVHTYNAESWYREIQTFISYSFDGGERWQEPASFPCGLNGVSLRQGIVMSNGEWLFPVYWQETRGGFDWPEDILRTKPEFLCGVAISSDEGMSFQRHGALRSGEGVALWEPNCVELEDGHIVMMMRAQTHLYVSESFDYGRSWSEPRKSVIPNSNTKITLLKVRGHIVLLNNPVADASWEGRTHLEIWISDDLMRSWKKKVPIMPPEEKWFYPHAFADERQRMLYVACENGKRHELIKISFDELGIQPRVP